MPDERVIITKDKLDTLANAVSLRSGERIPLTIDQMTAAVRSITPLKAQTKTVAPGTTAKTVTPDTADGYNGLSQVTVSAMPSGTLATPTITVSTAGLITAKVTQSGSGYIASGTNKSNTKQLTAQATATITPTKSKQTAVASGRYTTGTVYVDAIPDSYIIPSGTKQITENGTGIDVKAYEKVDVAVSGGGGVVAEALTVTANGVYTAPSGKAYSPVTVNVEGGASLPPEPSDVNFYDYDGTLLYSYTASAFAALSALPPNPTHSGLTAQGWNWTLSGAKTYVAAHGMLDIGQTYITDDGATRLYTRFENGTAAARRQMTVRFTASVNGGVTIDWGDGETQTSSGTAAAMYTHAYAADGDYVISLKVTSGTLTFTGTGGNNGYCVYGTRGASAANYNKCAALRGVAFGNGVTSIGDYGFYEAQKLEFAIIPSTITALGQYAFRTCYSLRCVILPYGLTTFPAYSFYSCLSLAVVSMPEGLISIGMYALSSSYNISRLTIPDTVNTIGTGAFQACNYLSGAVVTPSALTALIGTVFSNCFSVTSLTLTENITSVTNTALQNMYCLIELHCNPTTPPTLSGAITNFPSTCMIYVPSGSLAAYKGANYWSSYASRMQEE